MIIARRSIDTPIGTLTVEIGDEALRAIRFGACDPCGRSPLLDRTVEELDEYFAGKRSIFGLPLAAAGTPFQQSVWQALCEIPYGQTATYGQIADRIGRPRAARAVGMACNRNPIAVVIPCHRVVGSNGSLTGYAGGLDLKARLLALESNH